MPDKSILEDCNIRKTFRSYGLAPGELVDYDFDNTLEATVNFFSYSPTDFSKREVQNLADLPRMMNSERVNWVDISGYDKDVIGRIGEMFSIHPLVVEDINERLERPKLVEMPEYLFVTLKVFFFDQETSKVRPKRFSLILFNNLLITFHECEEGFLDPLKNRIAKAHGRLRTCGVDYLAFAVLDLIMDSTFTALDKVSESIEDFETEISKDPEQNILPKIHRIKHGLILLRRGIWPLREIFSTLSRMEGTFFAKPTFPFLRDLQDHAVHAAEITESMREEAASMLDLYMSSMANQLNHVMKILSIIGTIFLPLTFISSVYGMNFKYMPELDFKDAYPVVLGVMGLIAGIMLYYFKRKKWL